MISPITMLQQGGPMMFVIVLAGFAHLVALILQVVYLKKADIVPLLWAGVLCTIMLGMLGSVMGLSMAFAAVARASAETKQTLMAQGISVAMFTTMAALMLAIVQTFLTGIVASVVRSRRTSETGATVGS